MSDEELRALAEIIDREYNLAAFAGGVPAPLALARAILASDAHATRTSPRAVTFEVRADWPTPNHCLRFAEALDVVATPRYGDILRSYALAEEARFDEHGPIAALSEPTTRTTDPEEVTR